MTLGAWVRALQWFNPAVWLLSACLNNTSETSADDQVLAHGINASAYAGDLLSVAEAAQKGLSAAVPMARPGGVADRMKRIVSTGVDRRLPGRRFAFGIGGLFGVGGVVVAAGSIAQASNIRIRPPYQFGPVISEAKLKDGVSVRLVYMTGPNSKQGPAWRPDGTPAQIVDKALLVDATDLGPLSRAESGKRAVDFNFLATGLRFREGAAPTIRYQIKGLPNAGLSTGTGYFNGTTVIDQQRWLVPTGAQTVDFDCAVASTPYRTLAHAIIGDGKFQAKVGPLWTRMQVVPDPAHPGHTKINRFYDPKACTVKLVLPKELEEKDLRMLAHDGNGKLLLGNETAYKFIGDEERAAGRPVWIFNYRGNPAKDVVSFELQARDLEHVTLSGIHIQPNPAP